MANVTLRSTSNLLNTLPKRFASAAAAHSKKNDEGAAKQNTQLAREPLKVTKLSSGIVVATVENYSPVTRVAAVINAGSRDELPDQVGASHALRVFSNLATKNYSSFGLSRTLNQIGAELSVTSTREQTSYLLESTRNHFSRGVDILGDIVSRPEFREWELDEAHSRFQYELDVYSEKPELRIVDLIHQAAFRNALSRSLYAPKYNADSLHADTLKEFRSRAFTSNRLSLVGVGIGHDDLIRYADLFRLPGSNSTFKRDQAKYLGTELRENNLSEIVHVVLASEGVSLSSKELLVSGIVNEAFGSGAPRVKYSLGTSKLSKALSPLASHPSLISSFNANYTDTGLFGFHLVANKNDVGKLAKGLYKEIAKASKNGLTTEALNAAKNALKASIAYSNENSQFLIESIGLNAEQAQHHTNLSEIFKAIDNVSANDVNSFIKRLAINKPSMAAIGDLTELPRIDELNNA